MYQSFAYIYDALMTDVPYKKWADYYLKIAKRFGVNVESALDLGCGTASLTLEMAKRKIDMTGVDISEDMLCVARDKCEGQNVLLLNQSMTDFELYGTVDAVFTSLDSVNYLTENGDAERMFALINNYLNPRGIAIIDLNTPYKLSHVLGHNTFNYDDGDICYTWQNDYDEKTRLCEFDLTFFVRRGEYYERFDETHTERAYEINEIKEAAARGGLEFLACYEPFGFKEPRVRSQRVVMAFREKGKE